MKLMLIIGGSLFLLMFALAIIFPGGRIQSLSVRSLGSRAKANAWLVAISVVLFSLFGQWNGDPEPDTMIPVQSFAETPSGEDEEAPDPPRIACRYAVTTFQTRFDTVRIANFEPVVLRDNYTAPPQPVVIYGKQANQRPWEGTFARYVRPLEQNGIVLAVTDWERMGPCWVHKPDDPRSNVPAR